MDLEVLGTGGRDFWIGGATGADEWPTDFESGFDLGRVVGAEWAVFVDWESGLREGIDVWDDLRIEGTSGFFIVRAVVETEAVGTPTMPILRYLRMTGVKGAEKLHSQRD